MSGKQITNANTPSGVFQCFTADLHDGRELVPLRVSATTGPLTVKLSGGNGHPAAIVVEAASAQAPVTVEGFVCAENHAYDRPLAGGPRTFTAPGGLALSLSPSGWAVS